MRALRDVLDSESLALAWQRNVEWSHSTFVQDSFVRCEDQWGMTPGEPYTGIFAGLGDLRVDPNQKRAR